MERCLPGARTLHRPAPWSFSHRFRPTARARACATIARGRRFVTHFVQELVQRVARHRLGHGLQRFGQESERRCDGGWCRRDSEPRTAETAYWLAKRRCRRRRQSRVAGRERARGVRLGGGDLLRADVQRVVAGGQVAARGSASAAARPRGRCPSRAGSADGRRSPRAGRSGSAARPRRRSARARGSRAGPESGSPPAARSCTGGSAWCRAPPPATSSISLPRYITAIRSDTWRTTTRSWATNR